MNRDKYKLLNHALDRAMNIGIGLEPMDHLTDFFAEKIMVIGTAADEKYTSLTGLRKLIENQQEQTKGMDVRMTRRESYRDFSADETIAIVVEDIVIFISTSTESIQFDVRASTVLEFKNQQWKVIHWHASKPDPVESEVDTFGIEKWKQKAEELEKLVAERTASLVEKNRELEIEASLERVRTVAMAMNEPADMLAVCKTIASQLHLLGVNDIRNVQTAIFYEAKGTYMNYEYYARPDKTIITEANYTAEKTLKAFARKMLKGKDEVYTTNLTGKKLADWLAYQETTNVFVDPFLAQTASLHYYWYSLGPVALGLSGYAPLPDEDLVLFRRFRNVFDLAYRRYLDIEKAQAQAREAQIEAALEKVRSRSLAMYTTNEIGDVVWTVVEKMKSLDIEMGGISLATFIPGSKDLLHWYANTEHPGEAQTILLPYFDDLIFNDCLEARDKGIELFAKVYSKEEKNVYFNLAVEKSDFKHFPEDIKQWVREQPYLSFSLATQPHSCIFLEDYSGKSFLEEENTILIRFSRVFEQAYVRFLDLQKAEAQAREAQIEAALERVRAQTMAMHNSEDMGKCIVKMFNEVTALGVDEGTRFGIGILNHDNENNQLWTASKDGEDVNMHIGHLEMTWHPLLKSARRAWKERVSLHRYVLEGEDLLNYYQMLNNAPDYRYRIDLEKLPEREFHYGFVFDHGFFYAFSPREFQPDLIHIVQRFSSLFGQTYRRYLDLINAEAQAREAQIEVALERVRSRSLAMHKSDELSEVVSIVCEKLQMLNFVMQDSAAIICIFTEGSKDMTQWISQPDRTYAVSFKIPYTNNPLPVDIFRAKENGEDFLSKLYPSEIKNNYFNFLFENSDYKFLPNEVKKLILESENYGFSMAFSANSAIVVPTNSGRLLTENETAIVKRFANVFEQAYTRFLDLQKAEAQAREAQVEVALERVRARTMTMQTSEELSATAAEMFRQIQALGLSTWSCGFNIIETDRNQITQWVCTADGRMLPSFKTPSDEDIFFRFTEAARKGESFYVESMSEEALEAHYTYLNSLPEIKKLLDDFKESAITPPRFQVFNVAYFSYGYLLFITYNTAPEFHAIFERFSTVFDQTYTRFLDLQKAEAQAELSRQNLIQIQTEKQRAEDALAELKSTQNQLIQKEKLASLGELTAGIAHEIQNPLNFVNNFSEVSSELVDELKEEALAGHVDDVLALADDLAQNLQKITHHGGRASSIVKGMLEHSRTSSGEKQPTNLNALADEYLKIAYHGLRAKDNAFNCELVTEFDPNLGKVDLIPQDIGRVLLNLYNNAFYAVSQRQKTALADYKTIVSVSTRRTENGIDIRVSDNGTGISNTIKAKIFQPFFTTKPTGEGTGLGLSLSYDIVTNGHGGTLRVASTVGEGSVFIVTLPQFGQNTLRATTDEVLTQ